MSSKENEYKEIFMAEALDNFEELNRLLTQLEKNPKDKKSIDAVFRITHTLKGNAAGMGFEDIASLAHTIEDFFGEIRNGNLEMSEDYFTDIFKSIDILGNLIQALKTDKKVRYKGIKTKLEVILRRNTEEKEKEDGKVAKAEEKPKKEADSDKPVEEKTQDQDKKKAEKSKEPEAAKDKKEDNKEEQPKEDDKSDKTIEEVIEDLDVEEQVEEEPASQVTFSDLVQVPVRKLDNLLNLVGELIIERDRIITSDENRSRSNEYSRLYRISSDLQYSVMDVRLVQVGFLFNKFHRVVRDAANVEKKKVSLKLEGTETEIDRNILQTISDSLIHIIRNSVGHGIETPEIRKKAGKPEIGTVTLRAKSESDAVIIDIQDDGKGIDKDIIRRKAIEKGVITKELAAHMGDREIIMCIFEPGFSSMEEVTAISGRGVGMDVVKKAMDTIGGNINVETEVGKGTTISLRLPSSMAVKGALLFESEDIEYGIPLSYTEAVVSYYKSDIHKVGTGLVATYLDKPISIVFLKDLFDEEREESNNPNFLHRGYNQLHPEKKIDIIVVSYNERYVGIVVDKLLQQKEIVEKPLLKPVDNVSYISGTTILGTGNVCLIVNVPSIINSLFQTLVGNQKPVTS